MILNMSFAKSQSADCQYQILIHWRQLNTVNSRRLSERQTKEYFYARKAIEYCHCFAHIFQSTKLTAMAEHQLMVFALVEMTNKLTHSTAVQLQIFGRSRQLSQMK